MRETACSSSTLREEAVRDRRRHLRIAFVHTPMATISLEERRGFWQNFDRRYHAAHPGLSHMRRPMWELPHWMTWLAGVLEHEGYTDLRAVDLYLTECALSGIDTQRVLPQLREHPADVYLYSPMTPNLPFALEVAALVKQLYPGSANVFGGVVATPLNETLAAHPAVDFVVRGRGEYALPALLDAVCGLKELGEVGNLTCCRASGELVNSRFTYPWMPLESLPFPKVDLFPADTGLDIRYLRQVYALGCPYTCPFCTIQTIGQRPGYFPIPRVLAEIRAYREHYGRHHNIYFGDETFTANRPRTLALCAALEEEGNVGYDCQTRLNLVEDAGMLDALRRSGCRWIELGIESVDQQAQNAFKQRVKLRTLHATLQRVRDAGLPACSFMVNGFPNQTVDDMRRSIDFVCELIRLGLLQASYLFGLVPYPGSDLYNHPEKYGMKLHHREYQRYHEDLPPVFSTRYASAEAIYEVFLAGVRQLSEAMAAKPYFGTLPEPAPAAGFGAFWEAAHV